MNPPLIALACATETWDDVPYAAVRRAYVCSLEQVAGCVVTLIPGQLPPGLLSRFDGLVLGGHQSNVAPDRYGRQNGPGPFDTARDSLALSVVAHAVRADLPVLGICRGLQELNVAYGGTLRDLHSVTHQEDLSLPRDAQYLPTHQVMVAAGGVLCEVLGSSQPVSVNSLHRQAIDRLAPALRVEAVAPDGVIEAVSIAGAQAFNLGVQWHPEWYASSNPLSQRIFGAFGDAASARAAAREARGWP